MIHLQEVSSSMIKAIGHDPEELEMLVEFPNGSLYSYANVTVEQFDAFKSAESIGKHFIANFKKSDKHPWIKIQRVPDADGAL